MVLTAAVAFLLMLAGAGWIGAAALGRQWDAGAGGTLTVQVPGTSADKLPLTGVLAELSATPGVVSAVPLSAQELDGIVTYWFGTDIKGLGVPMPAVIVVHLGGPELDLKRLISRLTALAPGTLVEQEATWNGRMKLFTGMIQRCATAVVAMVTLVAMAVASLVTRAVLMARRDEIELIEQLGATQSYIRRTYGRKAALLLVKGELIGVILAIPVILALMRYGTPHGSGAQFAQAWISSFPSLLWLVPAAVMGLIAATGAVTARLVLRVWSRRML